jgi:hypothetical protein
LREQILHGGGPVWLEPEVAPAARQPADPPQPPEQPPPLDQVPLPAEEDVQVRYLPQTVLEDPPNWKLFRNLFIRDAAREI